MARQSEVIRNPYETELVREDGKLIEVVIRAVGDETLTPEYINRATREIHDRLRLDRVRSHHGRPQDDRLRLLRETFAAGAGRMTDIYLARLAEVYASADRYHSPIMQVIGSAIGRPVATVRGHVGRAREAGMLGPAEAGRVGGELTDKAKKILAES